MKNIIGTLALVLLLTPALFAQDAQSTITGTLQKSAATGGETTGWTVKVETAPESAKELIGKSLDIAPAANVRLKDYSGLDGKRVVVTGKLETKEWTQRGKQPLLSMSGIEALSDDASLMPLKEGNTWTYKSAEGEATLVVGKQNEDGSWPLNVKSETMVISEHLRVDKDGLKAVKIVQGEQTVKPSEPIIEFKFGTKKGDSWTQKVKFDEYEAALKGTNQGEETVKVPAGEFKAVKVDVVMTIKANDTEITMTDTRWYAKDVGIVKRQTKAASGDNEFFNTTAELTKHELKK